MDVKELRGQDIGVLKNTLMDLLKEHLKLRMQHKSAQLKDTSKLNKVKKSIAQIKTIIKEQQI